MKFKIITPILILFIGFVSLVSPLKNIYAQEAAKLLELMANEKIRIQCNNDLNYKIENSKTIFIECKSNNLTPTTITTPVSVTPSDNISGVPVCTDHDNTKWHGLVQRNSDESIKCTYGHEHKADPKQLDNVFGPVGKYLAGQEISYPWETSDTHGTENDVKHNLYGWEVVSVDTCKPSYAKYGFKNLRGQYHADGVYGATTRFHSYWLEAQACDPNDSNYKGIIRVGGHMDYGILYATGYNQIPLENDPKVGDDQRIHMGYINGQVPCCRNGDFTWYGSNRFINVPGLNKVSVRNGIRAEDFGAVDKSDLSKPVLNPKMWGGYEFSGNGSWHEPMHLLGISVPAELDAKDGSTDGYVTFNGYTDRNGNILTSNCSPLGPDCVPIVLEKMKVGNHQFRADVNGIKVIDYDVQVNGKSLINFPK